MKRFSRGSEWRKWDLHVHPPGTKLNDGYECKDGQLELDLFCEILYRSDVQAFGITDYFSLNGFFDVKERYYSQYPESPKVLFPNLELRLNEAVNSATEVVDFHIIFPPNLTKTQASQFLGYLKTQNTDGNGKQQSCADLEHADYERATVSRSDIENAFKEMYGQKSVRTDNCLLIAAVNNNGIRADVGSKRKMSLADEIDKLADGLFGSPYNTIYFLNPDRLEAKDQKAAPKPVFAGCDAHNFDDLRAWLGLEADGSNQKYVTWVKADLTYEGLQQSLIEPSERVRLQTTVPDGKEPYKVISRITFSGSEQFPNEVVFNSGLNAIIGSRSAGKSALLAYLAYSVDPEYTVRQQVAAGMTESTAGPGASITWKDVADIGCSVEWQAPAAKTGRVIYVPQNSLFAISERPDEITAKIQPVVFRNDAKFEVRYHKSMADVDASNRFISEAVTTWYSLTSEIESLVNEIRDCGDRDAVIERKKDVEKTIEALQKSSSLTAGEVETYQRVVEEIGNSETRLKQIEKEQKELDQYTSRSSAGGGYEATDEVSITLSMAPAPATLPDALHETLELLLNSARQPLLVKVKSALADYRSGLDTKFRELKHTIDKLQRDNKDLIEKSRANDQIAKLVKELEDLKMNITDIDTKISLKKRKSDEQEKSCDLIAIRLKERDLQLKNLVDDFNASDHFVDGMKFTIEANYDPDDVKRISDDFNKLDKSPYIIDRSRVDLPNVFSVPGAFIKYMGSGKQRLNRGVKPEKLTKDVFATTKVLRFVASLEGDRIGGFSKSSMTPGKQALFALKLILAETDEPWPLLIDQPEDDLDSRSVCDVIVRDLIQRKRERQIIMVSHDANLVIGADSEEIIVANRHGDDRPNKEGRMFDYLTGSLEYSKSKGLNVKFVLDSVGIREHACELLDGGTEAFQKRKDKYRI